MCPHLEQLKDIFENGVFPIKPLLVGSNVVDAPSLVDGMKYSQRICK